MNPSQPQAIRAATTSFTDIPLVDMAPLADGTTASRQAVAARICEACEHVGFLYVKNHGIPAPLIEAVFAGAKAFFDLTLEQKNALRLHADSGFRGYLPAGIDGGTTAGNRKEAFQMLREGVESTIASAPSPLARPNRWPAALPHFRTALLAWFDAADTLSRTLLELFAIGLGVPDTTFSSCFNAPLSMLRLLHYPPQPPTETAIGSQPHTDSGALTILAQDDAGGLEAVNDLGQWTRVKPIEGTLVVNLGEMMKLWSDGRFAATPHRVINTSGKDRISIPFFANPDFDTVIAPVISASQRRAEMQLVGHLERDGKTMSSGEIMLRIWNRLWGGAAAGSAAY